MFIAMTITMKIIMKISVQVEDIDRFEGFLHSLGIPTKRQTVKEDSVEIGQIFFHDPGVPLLTCMSVYDMSVVLVATHQHVMTDK
jgi:hypothetical protein